MNSLRDLRVVVTGAASGIGLATARHLHGEGARLVLADLRQESVDAALAELTGGEGTQPTGYACDIRSAEDCESLMARAEQDLGAIDALVHCAGVLRPPGGRPRPLYELEDEEYDLVVGTNLKGTFLVNRAALRRMVPHKSGQIVNLSSTSALKGRPLDSLYSASKAGVVGLTESIAEEMRAFGIRAQVVLPDAVDTPLWKQNGPISAPPPGSLPPERVAEVIAMCLSLPEDAVLDRLVIEPFRRRRMKKKRPKPETP